MRQEKSALVGSAGWQALRLSGGGLQFRGRIARACIRCGVFAANEAIAGDHCSIDN
jgi:hypothetical protein